MSKSENNGDVHQQNIANNYSLQQYPTSQYPPVSAASPVKVTEGEVYSNGALNSMQNMNPATASEPQTNSGSYTPPLGKD